MSAARAKRVERLEDAAALRAARAVAVDYGLTAVETAELERDIRRVLARWRAGLPIGLDWLVDAVATEHDLTEAEREEVATIVRARLADRAAGHG